MPQTLTEHGAAEGMAYVVHNVTYGELRPLAGAPADGDDYSYFPRQTHTPPLIPRQWVPVTEYNELVARVAEMEERIGRIESHITR